MSIIAVQASMQTLAEVLDTYGICTKEQVGAADRTAARGQYHNISGWLHNLWRIELKKLDGSSVDTFDLGYDETFMMHIPSKCIGLRGRSGSFKPKPTKHNSAAVCNSQAAKCNSIW